MWTKLSDEFLEDDTVCALRDRAYRLHVSAMVYAGRNLTDGLISDRAVKVLQAVLGYPVNRFVTELVDAGLWLPVMSGGYEIKNFLKYNPAAADVKAERERNRKRQQEWRERHKTDNQAPNALRAEGSNAAPTRPDPKRKKPRAVTQDAAERPGEITHIKTLIDDAFKEAS